MARSRPGSREDVRSYYRTVGRFIEWELSRRRDAPYWRARAEELGRPRILELGAGTGRVTRVLAPRGRSVVAVDLSREMLQRARAVLEGAGNVHLLLADIRQLALDATFDLAVAANDPFTHLPTDEERARAVRGVARHLRPEGLFVLDAHWLPPARRAKAMRPQGWRRERPLGDPEEGYSVRELWRLDATGYRGEIRLQYRQGSRVVGSARFHPRFWSPEEVKRRLRDAGLRIRRLLGGYRGQPWDPERARHLVVEAVRDPSVKGADRDPPTG